MLHLIRIEKFFGWLCKWGHIAKFLLACNEMIMTKCTINPQAKLLFWLQKYFQFPPTCWMRFQNSDKNFRKLFTQTSPSLIRSAVNAFCNFVAFQQQFNETINFREDMKRRTLAGNCGVAVFVIAFVCICVAFTTPSWLVSDYRITGAKLDRLGLWVHCFRSLPDVNDDYQRRFFVGCRWVYDPFTTGYDEIRGFLIPRKFNELERETTTN